MNQDRATITTTNKSVGFDFVWPMLHDVAPLKRLENSSTTSNVTISKTLAILLIFCMLFVVIKGNISFGHLSFIRVDVGGWEDGSGRVKMKLLLASVQSTELKIYLLGLSLVKSLM